MVVLVVLFDPALLLDTYRIYPWLPCAGVESHRELWADLHTDVVLSPDFMETVRNSLLLHSGS